MSGNVDAAGISFTILKTYWVCLTFLRNYCIFKWVKTFAAESQISSSLRPIFLMSCLTNTKFSLPDVCQMESLFNFVLIMTKDWRLEIVVVEKILNHNSLQ